MPTTTATELAQLGGLVTTDSSTSTVTVNGTLTATTITLPNSSVTAAKLANPQYTGFRNRIINGDMRIDQRNAGAAVTTSGAWPVDRFQIANSTDGNLSAQQNSSVPTGFIASLRFTTTTQDSSLTTDQQASIFQAIEGTNVSDLGWGTANAKTVTLSFWVRSSLTGTFGGSLRNSANDRAYPFTYTISAADTWEQKSVTIAGDTSGTWLTNTGRGIGLAFSMGAGPDRSGTAGVWAGSFLTSATGAVSVIGTLNATWYITGVQLEAGSTATDFERRPYGTELALCQRYFQSYGGVSATDNICIGASLNPTVCVGFVQLPVSMRTSPSVGFTSVNAVLLDDNGAAVVSNNILTSTSGTTSVYLSIPSATTAGLTANRPARMSVNGINARVTWSAEL